MSRVTRTNEAVVMEDFAREVEVGKGLAGALKLLRDQGEIKESNENYYNDKKKKRKIDDINEKYEQKEITIERRNKFGRIMAEKEAYKELCYKFHGKTPSKRKQEKRYQDDMMFKKIMQLSGKELPSLKNMKEIQASSELPYILLSIGDN